MIMIGIGLTSLMVIAVKQPKMRVSKDLGDYAVKFGLQPPPHSKKKEPSNSALEVNHPNQSSKKSIFSGSAEQHPATKLSVTVHNELLGGEGTFSCFDRGRVCCLGLLHGRKWLAWWAQNRGHSGHLRGVPLRSLPQGALSPTPPSPLSDGNNKKMWAIKHQGLSLARSDKQLDMDRSSRWGALTIGRCRFVLSDMCALPETVNEPAEERGGNF